MLWVNFHNKKNDFNQLVTLLNNFKPPLNINFKKQSYSGRLNLGISYRDEFGDINAYVC